MSNSLTVWSEPSAQLVPKGASNPLEIINYAKALNTRDQKQITSAFNSESYEMVAGFVLNKALSRLKKQLSSLGMEFVGEMLGRQDLTQNSIPTTSISNFEAIKLAQELGIINSTDAKRLGQHADLLAHFDELEGAEAESAEMSHEEAVGFLRTCVNSVLAYTDNYAPTEFVNFRSSLENRTFKAGDPEVFTLLAAPYFFKRTTLSILLSSAKMRTGAQYEHALGNIVVIVPNIWPQLKDIERWSVGQSYAEAVNAGSSPTVAALKRALMAVQGFDYVPETLRSQTFSAAASTVINVHTSSNNFYNEPAAVSALVKLGSTIPWPAFPICMSAIFSVYLGNMYGHTFAVEQDAKSLVSRLTVNQWEYFLNECFPNDQLVLSKLTWHDKPRARWVDLVRNHVPAGLQIKDKDVRSLISNSTSGNLNQIRSACQRISLNAGRPS